MGVEFRVASGAGVRGAACGRLHFRLMYRALPRWLAWVSPVMFLVLLLISIVLTAPGLSAGVGMLWMVVTSLTLATSRATSPAAG